MFRLRGLAVVVVVAALSSNAAGPAAAQPRAPKVSKAQRAMLESLVAAVERTAAAPETAAGASWQTHVLRASDGSHYVAVRALVAGAPAVDHTTLYVRLATHRAASPAGVTQTAVERSAVKEWLAGMRGEPLPMQAGRSVTVPTGEMPVGGAAASSRRSSEANDAISALRLLSLQQERAARDKAEREAKRLAELEAAGGKVSVMLPFEDFDVDARPLARPDGGLDIRRSVTAGPGDYDLFVAWTSGEAKAPATTVIHQRVTLTGATPAFGLSDIIVAEQVAAAQPYDAATQGAHPYGIGALDVTPAMGNVLSSGGTLGLVYQVINPAPGPTGKPSVDVAFQVTRLVDGRSVPFAALQAQRHDAANLPDDFDAAKGHPLFGAVRASLSTFPRGQYKVTVTAVDQVAARSTTADARFDVRGTPESLLREAPVPGQAFRRDSVLTPSTLAAVAAALRPLSPSDALGRSLDAARAGRFAELMRVDTALPAEHPVAQALLALGLYGLGDSPRTVALQLSQALSLGAPSAPVHLLLGATSAMSGDDKAAIAAWNQAREGGIDDAAVATLLIDAYLRQGDVARAGAMATAALDSQPGNLAARRALAATYIATHRPAEALRLLDAAEGAATDADTRFLRVHALYAGLVVRDAAFQSEAARTRFATLARQYVAEAGVHAELVREWLMAVRADARP